MEIANKHNMDSRMGFTSDEILHDLHFLTTPSFIMRSVQLAIDGTNKSVVSQKIEYVRYKSETSCVVCYSTTLKDDVTGEITVEYFYAKIFSPENYPDAKEKVISKHTMSPHDGSQTVIFDDNKIILYPLIDDTELKSLQSLLNARKLRRVLTSIYNTESDFNYRLSHKKMRFEVIRYKPEKRALVKVTTVKTNLSTGLKEDVSFYLKCDTHDRGEMVFLTLNRMMKEIPNISAPLYYDAEKNCSFYEGIDGIEVATLVHTSQFEMINKHAAVLLASVHVCSEYDKKLSTIPALLHDTEGAVKALLQLLPGSKDSICEIKQYIEEGLPNLESPSECIIHGDYSYEQLMYSDGSLRLLDFDRIALGDPLEDVGNYLAHLLYKEVLDVNFQSARYRADFVDTYKSLSPMRIPDDSIRYWTVRALLQLSIKPFRLYEKDWDSRIPKLLKVASNVLKNESNSESK